jgi:endonuclease V
LDGLDKGIIKENMKSLKKGGDFVYLKGDSGKIHGAIVQSTDNNKSPVYLSIGHKISLETSIKIVQKTCLYKNPEPVRQADLLSRKFIREENKNN